jgi:hypothetical protein
MIFPAASVNIQGNLSSFGAIADSGKVVYRRFCPNCGSGVANGSNGDSGIIVVLAGTLDDTTAFVPTVEIFCDKALPWAHNVSERKRFRGMPV